MALSTQAVTTAVTDAAARSETSAPGHDLEALLTTTWSEALGHEGLSPDDDFFDLGGNSLLVVHLRDRLAAEGIELAMPDVFRYPNVRALAGYLAN